MPTVGGRKEGEEERRGNSSVVRWFDADAIDGTAIATFKQGGRSLLSLLLL